MFKKIKSISQALVVIGMGLLLGGCQDQAAIPTDETQAQEKSISQAIANQEVFPDFEVTTLDNVKTTLSQYRGKIVILDLFATWCPPCRMEIPHLVDLQREHSDDLAVVGLSFDQTSADKVKQFAREMKINYPLYWGNDNIAKYVNLRGIPHLVILDQKGVAQKSYVGYQDKSVLIAEIERLSAKQAQP